jgi:hypothetical protein
MPNDQIKGIQINMKEKNNNAIDKRVELLQKLQDED